MIPIILSAKVTKIVTIQIKFGRTQKISKIYLQLLWYKNTIMKKRVTRFDALADDYIIDCTDKFNISFYSIRQ
jgi:hypothetical protein